MENLTGIETLVLIFVFGYVLGQFILTYRIFKVVKDFNSPGSVIIRVAPPTVKKLYSETIDNMIYIWDHESKDFVCQAKTLEECAVLSLKYSNIQYAAVKHNDNIWMFIDGEVKEKL